ncbi:MAG: class IV adenylate cyclase [Candidatus Aenigmarchaeota archaeon]|nr:class IV adenylate cyclase [Candidatus Aenigmarchaeota archaeon]
MANNDIEIEIKFPLDEINFYRVKKKLNEIANFVKKTRQIDEYFTPFHRNFVEPKFPFEWLSIRRRGDKAILNYKHWHPENVEVSTHCDEFETEIKNPDKLEKIFSSINLKKLVAVEKERETYTYNDEFEIALDMVKDLGYFIEVEAIKDFGSVETTREKLFEFAKKLGIDISKTDKRGYPFLLMEKKGLIKS